MLGDEEDGRDELTQLGDSEVEKLSYAFSEGLQWVMYYYHRGADRSGWKWYFPYFYAPLAVDMYRIIANALITSARSRNKSIVMSASQAKAQCLYLDVGSQQYKALVGSVL